MTYQIQKEDIVLPYHYLPRIYQVLFWQALEAGKKRHDLVWHRRAGKDITVINATSCAMCGQDTPEQLPKIPYGKIGTYFYFFPTFAQGKKVIWDGMTKEGIRFTDFIPQEKRLQTWNDEMKIRLKNGSLFQIIGTDNYDAIMGTNPVWCVFSEFALQNPKAWEFVRPILKENKGIAIFAYTPRGKNHAYKLHLNAENHPERWFSQVLTIDDTKVLTKADVDEEIADGMSEELASQEFYCEFLLGVEGSFYGRSLEKAKNEGRIKPLLLDSSKPVHTAWDIGVDDFTSVIFFQFIKGEYFLIDFYENNYMGLDHYAKVLQDKGYIYGRHFGPHDLKDRVWANSAKTVYNIALNFGINFDIIEKTSVSSGIEAVRNTLNKSYIDESKCSLLIDHLNSYRKRYNRILNEYTEEPVHDSHSHAADAMRMLALADIYEDNFNYKKYYEMNQRNIDKHSGKYGGV
jgi:hypothetical protein